MTFYTETGLAKLADLIFADREQRGLSLRDYAGLVSGGHRTIDHKTIDRLESHRLKTPSNAVLAQIAPILGLTLTELIAIASSPADDESVGESSPATPSQVPTHPRTAEEVFSILCELPITELERCKLMIDNRLRHVEVLEKKFHEP